MKLFLWVTFAILTLASFVAWRLEPVPVGAGKTLLVWSTDDNPVRQAQVDLFNKLNPDLWVMIDPANRDQAKVIVQSVAGVGPDLFDCYSANFVEAYVRSGVALDVTDELAKDGIFPEKIVWPIVKDCFMYQGRSYGFPCNAGANAIWFNKDMFDRAGLAYPKPDWTWDDLIRAGKKLTTTDARGKPETFGLYWEFSATYDLIYQHGGRQYSPDMTRCVIDSREAIKAVELSQSLMYTHKIAPSPTQESALATSGGWASGGLTLLMGQRVAMAWGGRWWLNRLRSEKGLRLGAVPLPLVGKTVFTGGGRATLVNRFATNRAAAVRFVKYLASREYNELVNDQADALSPVKEYCYTDRYLHNPEFPQETDNEVWRFVTENAIQSEINPFVSGAELAPLQRQIDLVKAGIKDADSAMKQAAIDMNERIVRNARLRPYLGKLYEERTGRKP